MGLEYSSVVALLFTGGIRRDVHSHCLQDAGQQADAARDGHWVLRAVLWLYLSGLCLQKSHSDNSPDCSSNETKEQWATNGRVALVLKNKSI